MNYTAEEVIERAKSGVGYDYIPEDYWWAFIRRNKDEQMPNQFNDIANLMHGDRLVMSTTCTTVPGLPALQGGFRKYNKDGAAVVCAGIWMYKAFKFGLHSGRMRCLRQDKWIWSTRDGDLDSIAEEQGKKSYGMWNTNIHAASYKYLDKLIRKWIGAWSYGCLVCNNRKEYDPMIDLCEFQDGVSVIILDEWSI